MGDPDSPYKIRSDSGEVIESRFQPKAGKVLSEKKWRAAFDKQGRLDISKVLVRIQGGGVDPSIREEVWEFLLGCFAPDSTYVERATLRKSRREEYFQIKAECQKLDPAVGSGTVVTLPRVGENGPVNDIGRESDELPRSIVSLIQQDSRQKENNTTPLSSRGMDDEQTSHRAQFDFSNRVTAGETQNDEDARRVAAGNSTQENKVLEWKTTLHQIGLDVVRTDRSLEFYEKPSNLAKLWDILAIYSWLDPDIGYCQGMSDLCSPMVVLFHNEADAFWCFERLMHRLRENFRCTDQAVGVQKQLANLGLVLQVIDPKLYKHLDELGGGSFIFAFRMLMVLFRREFSFSDSLYLWEIMWALEFDPDEGHPSDVRGKQPVIHVSRHPIRDGWILRRGRTLYKWGKFERQNIKYGEGDAHEIPIVVFCAASIFESQRLRLQGAVGLDEVLKILNDVTGKLDAKKACKEALKLHKKYLLKAASMGRRH